MISTCFRRPEVAETVQPLMTRDIVSLLARSFPEVKQSQGMNIRVGRVLKAMNFERKELAKGTVYYIVPLPKAA